MQNTLTVTSAAGAPCGVWGSTYMVWLMRPDNRTLGGMAGSKQHTLPEASEKGSMVGWKPLMWLPAEFSAAVKGSSVGANVPLPQ